MSHGVITHACPLCRSETGGVFFEAHERVYGRCGSCQLMYLRPEYRLSATEEKARYEKHENDPSDPEYRKFLGRFLEPLLNKLSPQARGLDYGSGPGPTLSVMLEELGFRMEIYDPHFCPNRNVLKASYDFITCTETAEHFRNPGYQFEQFKRLLLPGGWLGVMTEMVEPEKDFGSWYYPKDPTHIVFYQRSTFEWIAQKHGWPVEFPIRNVALFCNRVE